MGKEFKGEIIKIETIGNIILILVKQEEAYMIGIARTNPKEVYIESQRDEVCFKNTILLSDEVVKIVIPLVVMRQGKDYFKFIPLENKDDYNAIKMIVEEIAR